MIGGVLVNFFGKNGLLSFPFFFDETLQFFSNTSINTQIITEYRQKLDSRSHILFLAFTVVRIAVQCASVVKRIRADRQLTAVQHRYLRGAKPRKKPTCFWLKCPKPVGENAGEKITHHWFPSGFGGLPASVRTVCLLHQLPLTGNTGAEVEVG